MDIKILSTKQLPIQITNPTSCLTQNHMVRKKKEELIFNYLELWHNGLGSDNKSAWKG